MTNGEFITLIGICLALGKPELAHKLEQMRNQAGFIDPIDWSQQ